MLFLKASLCIRPFI